MHVKEILLRNTIKKQIKKIYKIMVQAINLNAHQSLVSEYYRNSFHGPQIKWKGERRVLLVHHDHQHDAHHHWEHSCGGH